MTPKMEVVGFKAGYIHKGCTPNSHYKLTF